MPFNTLTVATAVTPGVIETYFSHFINRKQLRQKPTAHITYHEGLQLVRHFLQYASRHTVEDVQAFTAQYVPSPTWVHVKNVAITDPFVDRAADVLRAQFGERGLEKIGGKSWWRWRPPNSALRAEWIEMRKDYNERKRKGEKGERIIFYIHGGAYYFGSVDEHRYQMQRHARKLKARLLAPRYRLAPQFPFPCGLLDCLATYFFLLDQYDTSSIIVAGDSAGGGMSLSMLCVLRDQKQPLPAGAILLSPWVDLTHSFPSLGGDPAMDYIPPWGFVHKPSMAWPPAASDGLKTDADSEPGGVSAGNLKINLDGEEIEIKEQIQMYTTNELLSHPLVSSVMQPSLGGLPPMLIQTGGGELLRDEQIYIAHKAANPRAYPASEAIYREYDPDKKTLEYPPTYVQLQVWEDLCHVPHTLSFTRPAKYMYRSVAQFGAWALAHAQNKGIEIQDDDAVSIISSDEDEEGEEGEKVTSEEGNMEKQASTHVKPQQASIGRAGDPLPQFKEHMIRQRVTRHGVVYPLAHPAELPALQMATENIGAIKPGPVRKWLAAKKSHEVRFASEWKKIQAKRESAKLAGYEDASGNPPPTALAGRRRTGMVSREKKKGKSWGLALWSGWGSSHDEQTLEREEKTEKKAEVTEDGDVVGGLNETVVVPEGDGRGRAGRRPSSGSRPSQRLLRSRGKESSRSPYKQVRDQGQMDGSHASEYTSSGLATGGVVTADAGAGADAGVAATTAEDDQQQGQSRSRGEAPPMFVVSPASEKLAHTENTFLSPTSTRPHNQEMAYPFKLQVPGRTASTVTLDSFAMGSAVPAGGAADSLAERDAERSDSTATAGAAAATQRTATPASEQVAAGAVAAAPAVTDTTPSVAADLDGTDDAGPNAETNGTFHQHTSMLGSVGPDGIPMADHQLIGDDSAPSSDVRDSPKEGDGDPAATQLSESKQRPALESFVTASEGQELKG